MLLRAGRRTGWHAARDGERREPADDGSPRNRVRWFARRSVWAALISMLAVAGAVTMTPAKGASDDIASGLARAVRLLVPSATRDAQAFAGTPAVGALFTTSAGKLSNHFCSASVVSSPNGDLVVTAAHCVSATGAGLEFVPGYDDGATPYGVWAVTKVYVDRAWSSSSDPDDDVAFLRVSQPGSIVPIEDVTGAEQIGTGTSARQPVEVIGYPASSGQPIACRNWTSEPMPDQLEFDCGGYTDGTSGGPFLASVDPLNGQGTVVGVIGGFEQGGDLAQVSYSAIFGANVLKLYQEAVAGG